MEDLIKRSDAIEAITFSMLNALNTEERISLIMSLPSAERKGEWIKHEERTETNGKFIDFFPAEYECSNCGLREAHYFINSKPHNYCPNCGAKMKGAEDE